ncbi:MAG: hypothetical protein AAFX90_08425 [Pseudomonadota bacterium]
MNTTILPSSGDHIPHEAQFMHDLFDMRPCKSMGLHNVIDPDQFNRFESRVLPFGQAKFMQVSASSYDLALNDNPSHQT